MKTPRDIAQEVEHILADYYVKRYQWEKYQAPVPESYLCQACEAEADREEDLEHEDWCPIARWRAMNPEYYGDQHGENGGDDDQRQ